MLKKFVLSTVCLVMTAALYAGSVKVDHSSKEKLIESLLYSIINQDQEAFGKILPQSYCLSKSSEQVGKYQKSLWNTFTVIFSPWAVEQLKAAMDSPVLCKKLVKNYVELYRDYFICFNDQWYLDTVEICASFIDNAPIPACPAKVDNSSKESVFVTMWLALYHKNYDLFWECLSPDSRKVESEKVKDVKSDAAVKKMVAEKMFVCIPQDFLITTVKMIGSGLPLTDMVDAQKFFIKESNGKWYFSLTGK